MSLLSWAMLVCPHCKGSLELPSDEMSRTPDHTPRLPDGFIRCHHCPGSFPVKDGIPYFFDAAMAKNLKKETFKIKTKNMFEYEWKEFEKGDMNFGKTSDRELAEFMTKLGLGKEDMQGEGLCVLDLGCGMGSLALALSREFPNIYVFGLDLTNGFLKTFRLAREQENLNFLQGDIFQLPFPNECFDIVYAVGVIHHLDKPEEAFAQIAKHVKKGGWLCVMVYSRPHKAIYILFTVCRKILTFMPLWLLKIVSHLCAPFIVGIWGIKKKARGVKEEYMNINLRSAPHFIFDFLAAPVTHVYDQGDIEAWYRKRGFRDIRIVKARGLWCRGKKV